MKAKKSSSSNLLLVDIGNTNVSIALADVATGKFRCRAQLAADAGRRRIRNTLAAVCKRFDVARAVLASVNPPATLPWRKESASATGAPPLATHWKMKFDFRFGAYPRPETIGADRLADACAAVWLYGAPVITVDCGTATVVNAINARGVFDGGLILPGAPLFLEYLAERTALLPMLAFRALPRRAAGLGCATESAMRLGAKVGFEGMALAAIAKARCALADQNAPVIITGGYACRLAGLPDKNIKHEPDLALLGLWRIHALNFGNRFCMKKTQKPNRNNNHD